MRAAFVTPARLAAALGHRLPPAGACVGLLGGSFNPAHGGHRRISLAALGRLGLDEVWWLVSPQNPLKEKADMAPLAARLDGARRQARHPRIRVTALESLLATRYTAESIAALNHNFPRVRFVWLMGADNLIQLPAWKNWPEIFGAVAVAVFDRPTYSFRACATMAARRYARHRLPESSARRLVGQPPPAWVFLHTPLDTRSATAIRAGGRARVRAGRDAPPG